MARIILSLEMTISGLKMMVKSGLKICFEIPRALSELLLPRKAELAWLVSRYLWRGTWNFKIFFSRPLFTIILSQKSFQDLRFSSLILAILGGVFLTVHNAVGMGWNPFWRIIPKAQIISEGSFGVFKSRKWTFFL